jgi:3-oxoacyl-[acyl-carrier protein] reductase
MLDYLDLTGRVAIVTGASRGIGSAIAERLASKGATLILNTRSNHLALESLAEQLSSKYKVPVSVEIGDVARERTSVTLVKAAFSHYKRLDIYVNNAGVLLDGLIGMVPEQDISATIDVNLKGVIFGTQAAARLMRRGGGGSIINMSSIIGRVGNKGQLVYAASKAGVIGATLASAKELAAHNIRVNAIAPGFIDTDMARQIPADKFSERMASIGLSRIGSVEDIANVALFLASDMSGYMTGQVIGVDGGMLI